jgi:hypothetical protein
MTTRHRSHSWESVAEFRALAVICAALLFLFSGAGCKSSAHTSDPRLRKIDELLSAALPKGTPRSRVEFFLSTRGYSIEVPADRNTVVALVHHVDPKTLEPSTARVTFRFDANDNLTTYYMEPAPEPPLAP